MTDLVVGVFEPGYHVRVAETEGDRCDGRMHARASFFPTSVQESRFKTGRRRQEEDDSAMGMEEVS